MSSFSLTQTFGPKLAENQKLRIHLSGSASFDTITRSGLNLIKKQSKLRKKSNYTILSQKEKKAHLYDGQQQLNSNTGLLANQFPISIYIPIHNIQFLKQRILSININKIINVFDFGILEVIIFQENRLRINLIQTKLMDRICKRQLLCNLGTFHKFQFVMDQKPDLQSHYVRLMRNHRAISTAFLTISLISILNLTTKTWLTLSTSQYHITLPPFLTVLCLACTLFILTESLKVLPLPKPNVLHVAAAINLVLTILCVLLTGWMGVMDGVLLLCSVGLVGCSLLMRRMLRGIIEAVGKLALLKQYRL